MWPYRSYSVLYLCCITDCQVFVPTYYLVIWIVLRLCRTLSWPAETNLFSWMADWCYLKRIRLEISAAGGDTANRRDNDFSNSDQPETSTPCLSITIYTTLRFFVAQQFYRLLLFSGARQSRFMPVFPSLRPSVTPVSLFSLVWSVWPKWPVWLLWPVWLIWQVSLLWIRIQNSSKSFESIPKSFWVIINQFD